MMVSYSKWNKRFRSYTDQGIGMLEAWYKTNKDFDMDEEETKGYEIRINVVDKQE